MFSCLRRMRLTGELKGRFVRIKHIATKLNNKTECKRDVLKMPGCSAGWEPLISRNSRFLRFLAPRGAQEVTLCVCPSVYPGRTSLPLYQVSLSSHLD